MPLHPPHPLSSSPHLFPLSIKEKKYMELEKDGGYGELNAI